MKYSVLMSLYDKEDPYLLKQAIDSVYASSVLPDQVVVVKDGPINSKLEAILSLYHDISYCNLLENHGLSYALNEGLKLCCNEIVARMDTDDICMPMRFEKQLRYLQDYPEVDIVGTYAAKINEKGDSLNEILSVPTTHEDIMRLIWTCPFNHPTVMFRKSKILSVGGYNPCSGPRQDDYELWFRCAENNLRFANIAEPLLYYRFFADSVRKNNTKVGWYRLKVGMRGCKRMHLSFVSYIGVTIPFIRSLLPYPFNVYFQKLMNRFNPKNKRNR